MNSQTSTKTVYRIDPETNLFLFTEEAHLNELGIYHVPGNCIQVSIPEHSNNEWPKWNSSVPRTNHQFGQPGTGSWDLIPDYRKANLYLTENGQEYTPDTKQEIEGQEKNYPGYGELPNWLTTQERPSQFHNWDGSSWILDDDALTEHEIGIERGWRNGELNSILWIGDRHRDELELELTTTLSNTQYLELQEYIQQLRDWPAQLHFPDPYYRPERPEWLESYFE